MKPNYLHIWPRNTFMMIALPNLVSGAPKLRPLASSLRASLSIQKRNPLEGVIDLRGVLTELISPACCRWKLTCSSASVRGSHSIFIFFFFFFKHD